jgi:hypothetical protein
MKRPLVTSFMIAIVAATSGCTPTPKKARYTVEQYLADRQLMNSKVQECANNPGELRNDPDCINAGMAASRDSWGSLRDLPPIFGPEEATDKPGTSSAQ